MATLSTTAWVLHELGLAAGFGGNLFGQLALNPAVKAVESKRDRGKVTHVAWDRYKAVNGVSLLAMAGTWLIGRTMLSGREVGPTSRVLTIAKDVLVAGAVIGGVGSIIVGALLDKAQRESGFAIEDGATPAPETPAHVARLQRLVNVFGTANIGFQAGILATTTVLAMKSGKSSKWSFVSQLLP
jgi:hypothetical protein